MTIRYCFDYSVASGIPVNKKVHIGVFEQLAFNEGKIILIFLCIYSDESISRRCIPTGGTCSRPSRLLTMLALLETRFNDDAAR